MTGCRPSKRPPSMTEAKRRFWRELGGEIAAMKRWQINYVRPPQHGGARTFIVEIEPGHVEEFKQKMLKRLGATLPGYRMIVRPGSAAITGGFAMS